ncbi:hypothetical protein MHM_03630 [Candidatus Mycoplasma haemominutum 'Birmingham 1']|uniref:Uncharacterized protein n=1 Tax=Candidatus Mycoplasma haematominutum 'Birmingham 1' TaxID=1116213 RepID=G8C3I3_9MOLU|nr:hypothetical protein MHM_03630 [Candidatus Mycoplasma haematominutum 'Birmingham 1']
MKNFLSYKRALPASLILTIPTTFSYWSFENSNIDLLSWINRGGAPTWNKK